MVENDRGFLIPQIGDGCVACGLCVAVCPEKKNPYSQNEVIEVWAAADIKKDNLKESTSGGVFALLAEQSYLKMVLYLVVHGMRISI